MHQRYRLADFSCLTLTAGANARGYKCSQRQGRVPRCPADTPHTGLRGSGTAGEQSSNPRGRRLPEALLPRAVFARLHRPHCQHQQPSSWRRGDPPTARRSWLCTAQLLAKHNSAQRRQTQECDDRLTASVTPHDLPTRPSLPHVRPPYTMAGRSLLVEFDERAAEVKAGGLRYGPLRELLQFARLNKVCRAAPVQHAVSVSSLVHWLYWARTDPPPARYPRARYCVVAQQVFPSPRRCVGDGPSRGVGMPLILCWPQHGTYWSKFSWQHWTALTQQLRRYDFALRLCMPSRSSRLMCHLQSCLDVSCHVREQLVPSVVMP